MSGNKDGGLAQLLSAYKWYGLVAVALAGNVYFERAAVQSMAAMQVNQGVLASTVSNHMALPSHRQIELRVQRDEMVLEELTDAITETQKNAVDFMETVNVNFIAIQTQLHITALMSEKRDLQDRSEQLERVIERMETNSEVVPIIYRQSLAEKRQELININNTISGLQL